MRPSSCKAKGRRHQQQVVKDILQAFPHLTPDDVRSTSMGASGEDILMSPHAQECVPLSIECKNCERLNIWSAVQQAESNCPTHRSPCVVFTKNRSSTYAVIPWNKLVELLKFTHQSPVDMNIADRHDVTDVIREYINDARVILSEMESALPTNDAPSDVDGTQTMFDVDESPSLPIRD